MDRIHVEAVDAEAVGPDIGELARRGLVGDVPDAEAARLVAPRLRLLQHRDVGRLDAQRAGDLPVRAPLGPERGDAGALPHEVAPVLLHVGDHQVARDAHLVGVRVPVGRRDLGHDLRRGRVAHVDDRRAVGRLHVPDIGVAVLHDDLPAAGNVQMPHMLDVPAQDVFDLALHSAGASLALSFRRRSIQSGATMERASATRSALPMLDEKSVVTSPPDFCSASRT